MLTFLALLPFLQAVLAIDCSAPNAPICSSYLWQTSFDCGNSVAPKANGCCANGQCPPGCASSTVTSASCTCINCPFARTPLLQAMTVRDQWTKAHNYYRCRHGAPPLTWDTTVASNAQTFVATCPTGTGTPYQNTPSSGQNMGQGYANLFATTAGWYANIAGYDPSTSGCTCTPSLCGSYTAVVWNSTTLIGCGSQTCASNSMYVCQYAAGAPNVGSNIGHVPPTNTPVNTDTYCCDTVFGGKSSAPTAPTATAAPTVSAAPTAPTAPTVSTAPTEVGATYAPTSAPGTPVKPAGTNNSGTSASLSAGVLAFVPALWALSITY